MPNVNFRRSWSSFVRALAGQGINMSGLIRSVAMRAHAAGWHDCEKSVAEITEVRIKTMTPVDTPRGVDPLPLEDACATWLSSKDLTMFNRRQTAKMGFVAGWHSRKLAEFKWALGLPYGKASVFRAGWANGAAREQRNMDATAATLEGRNWFRDSTGRVWVDARSELADQWAEGNPEFFAPLLDAGIPVG